MLRRGMKRPALHSPMQLLWFAVKSTYHTPRLTESVTKSISLIQTTAIRALLPLIMYKVELRGSKDADGKSIHVLSEICSEVEQMVGHTSSRGMGMELPYD